MDYACSVELSGMLSLQGLAFDKVRGMCEELSAVDPSHSVSIAIEQYPKAVSLGGSLHILNKIMNREHKLVLILIPLLLKSFAFMAGEQ